MVDRPSDYFPALYAATEDGGAPRPISTARPLTLQEEEDVAAVQRRLMLRNKPLPPTPDDDNNIHRPLSLREHEQAAAIQRRLMLGQKALPPLPPGVTMAEHDDDTTHFYGEDGLLPVGDLVSTDENGRTIVTRSLRHKGRPASVMVELGEDGRAKQILSGTARLPGETDRQYFRHMSSFAGWQLQDTVATKGISWHGNQKHPFFCYSVMVVTFAILLAEIGENGWTVEPFEVNPVFGPKKEVLIKLGAKQTSLILQGEFHRLISAFWLHGGVLHWVVNMIALINLGFSLEREFGTPKIGLLFVACGFMGVLTSAVFLPHVTGVGASGAIFGLFGCAWADLIQNWSLYVTRKQHKIALCQLTVGTIVNLLIGFAPALDQFAHIGGLLTGMLLGFSLTMEKRYTRFAEEKPWTTKQRVLRACGLTVVPVSLVVLMAVLYSGQDVSAWCVPCSYLNCIPIEGLWACDYSGCSDDPTVRGVPYLNNTMHITCPGGQKTVWTAISSVPTAQDLLYFCQQLC